MASGHKGYKGYRGRAAVPRPGGPMTDRKKAASKKAARGYRCGDHTDWADTDERQGGE